MRVRESFMLKFQYDTVRDTIFEIYTMNLFRFLVRIPFLSIQNVYFLTLNPSFYGFQCVGLKLTQKLTNLFIRLFLWTTQD